MKTKMKITDTFLSSLPAELADGIADELKTAEVEPYIKRAGFSGLDIDQDEERVAVARMSTRDIDSDSEIVMPYSLDIARYQSNPVVLLNHSWSETPIGSASSVRLHDLGIDGKIAFADTPRGNEVWSLVRDKHMRANSIGFVILDYVSRSHPDYAKLVDRAVKEWPEFTARHAEALKGFIRRGILLENSIVTIPANAHALMEAVATRSMTLSPEMIDLLHLDVPEDAPVGEQAEEEADKNTETIEISVDPEDDVESVEIIDPENPETRIIVTIGDAEFVEVPIDFEEDPEEEPQTQTAGFEPKLVARLVRRAEKPKTVDPKLVARLAADQIDLKLGKI